MAEAAASYRDWPGQGLVVPRTPGSLASEPKGMLLGSLGFPGSRHAWAWGLPGSWVELFGSRACLGLGGFASRA